jgi:predicted RNase H-like HicB family nuclease
MKKIELQTVIYKEGPHYVAQCLNVDVSSFGASEKEALSNIREALELYLEDSYSPAPEKISEAEITPLTLSYA